MYSKNKINIGDIILYNNKKEFIYFFNFNNIAIYLGNNISNKILYLTSNKIILNNINNEENYIMIFNKNIEIISYNIWIKYVSLYKIFDILMYDLITINEYSNIILKTKLIDDLLIKYIRYDKINKTSFINIDQNFLILFKTLEDMLSVKFKKRFNYCNEFILYNHIYFKYRFIVNNELE